MPANNSSANKAVPGYIQRIVRHLRHWCKEILFTLLLIIVVIVVMDIWRAPKLPDDFASTTLYSIDDEIWSIQELSSRRPLLIYVWASWCGPCRYTSPTVESLYQQGENVLTVAYRSGDQKTVRQYLAEKGYQFPVVNDDQGTILQHWQTNVVPVFIITYQGKLSITTAGWSSYWGIKLRLWWAKLKI